MFIFFKATILNSVNFKHFYFIARRVTNTILKGGLLGSLRREL